MLFKPLVPLFAEPEKAWLVLAMASTYAGNLTLLGSVANLIVAEGARPYGVDLSFGKYLKAGLPITIATTAIGTAWVLLVP
jgi:Na+/H+ antiporter NhaD/arsenite permease-like protein